MAEDVIDPKVLEAAAAWDAIARMHGYNEMTKLAKSLGEKMYCRLACDAACEEAMKLGAEITRTETGGQVLFTINEVSPSIRFRESDIDGMRKAVAEWDAAQTAPPLRPRADETKERSETMNNEPTTPEACNFVGDDGVRCQRPARFAVQCSPDPYDVSHVCANHRETYEHVAEWPLPQ